MTATRVTPPELAEAIVLFARAYSEALNRRLAGLLRAYGPTPYAGWIYRADGAGDVARLPHVGAGPRRRRAKSAVSYYDGATGRWG